MPVFSTMGAMTYSKSGTLTIQIPPPVGTFAYGGYYAGISSQTASTYNLIIVIDRTQEGQDRWSTANTLANNINYNGYTDWRLPTSSELFTMCSEKTVFASIGQQYNTTPNTASSVYWSSTFVPFPVSEYRTILFWSCASSTNLDVSTVSLRWRAVRIQSFPKVV